MRGGRTTRAAALCLTLLAANGCNSLLASFSDGPIEEGGAEERTLGQKVDDKLLAKRIHVNLHKSDKNFSKANVKVTVRDGAVLLTGQAAEERLSALAEKVASDQGQQRKVYNNIQIAGRISWMARFNDWCLRSKFSMRTRFSKADLPDVAAVVSDSVLFLFGSATRRQADNLVEIARKSKGLKQIVRIFEYSDGEPRQTNKEESKKNSARQQQTPASDWLRRIVPKAPAPGK